MTSPKPIYGVDISHFPGMPAMKWLREKAKVRFACFYLGPTENHPGADWMGQRTDLAVAGWGLVPTYVGQQAHVKRSGVRVPNPALNAGKGASDGNQACDLMKSAGFSSGAVVYIDLEEGDEPAGAYQAYILAWMDAVKKRSFVPAVYCPGGALQWALQYGRIVWLAAPDNLDARGNAITATLDPTGLPLPSPRKGPLAIQFKWEIEFQGLDEPADGGHGPRFDLNVGLVADPSDYASVDRALLDVKETMEVAELDEATVAAQEAFDRFVQFKQMDAAVVADAPVAASPTSDPKCGPASGAVDKIMPDQKIALNLAEDSLAVAWMSSVADPGPSEQDLAELLADAPAAHAPDPWAKIKWPEQDAASPDYCHLASSLTLPVPPSGVATLADFELKPEDVELVLSANSMNPIGFDDIVALAVRGARLGKLDDKSPPLEAEKVPSTWITELRPDHKNFRCLIGFYGRDPEAEKRNLTLYAASTVPNAEYVQSWFNYANGKTTSGIGNMMPSGCYVYRVGVHNSPHAGAIKPALRLTDSFDLHVVGTATVLRTKNDLSYGLDDVWCKTIPADNVHCSFQTTTVPGWGAPFSSAGCMTIRGHQAPTDQWKKAQVIMNRLGQGKRCDLVLITGRDLAIAAELRRKNQAGDPTIVRRELGRLRPGSQGPAVDRLQDKLGIERTSYFGSVTKKALVDEQSRRRVPVDGIFSPTLNSAWNWRIFDDIA
ncbi:glycoside hydrolase domain-containing protein [Bradyrhizobium sp. DN5]|uniref:glycoside hydrolase domain-containing protein n=1 Tax=Bradyrhizobium sp. DN5 TaxID=3056950 RepID=UPI00352401FD